ncbi:Ferrous iron permease EfeU precursor [compost metagenome]
MPGTSLAGGIAAGFGVLALGAVILIKAGTRLPVRPVFLISSVIVFYLCFKFMGSGIHSLQMAGVLPSTVKEYLPDYAAISLYPSWYSTLPQLIFLLIGILVLVWGRTSSRRTKTKLHTISSV